MADYSVVQVQLQADPGSVQLAIPRANIAAKSSIQNPIGSFSANQNNDPGPSWRMTYDGEDTMMVTGIFFTDGITSTVWDLYCGPTQQDCIDQAALLGLTIPDGILNGEPGAQPPTP
jgi:hypothetical protein